MAKTTIIQALAISAMALVVIIMEDNLALRLMSVFLVFGGLLLALVAKELPELFNDEENT